MLGNKEALENLGYQIERHHLCISRRARNVDRIA